MADQLKNLMIGLFVIAAVTIIILVLLFLHPTSGNEGRKLHIRFANIDKISLGTRVTFGGKPVGEVVEIKELPDAIDHRIEHDGFVYVYELTCRVDTSVNVYDSDEVTARTSGLLGEKSIAITPKAPPAGQKLVEINDRVIYAMESASVEDTLKELKGLADKLDTALDGVNDNLASFKKADIWGKVGDIGSNLVDITAALNKPDELSGTIENFLDLSSMAKDTLKNFDTSVDNINVMTGHGKILFADISEGKGSFGSIFVKDDISLKVNALLNKADIVLNDINHYGLLYQSDKGWQRLRARRLNLLGQLSNPQEFRNYFNDEIDQISTSISRVSMVLDETGGYPCCEALLENREYGKVYAELLRKVEGLQESIKMYNQQIVDAGSYQTELCPPCIK